MKAWPRLGRNVVVVVVLVAPPILGSVPAAKVVVWKAGWKVLDLLDVWAWATLGNRPELDSWLGSILILRRCKNTSHYVV